MSIKHAEETKLSLVNAILININVMLGTGMFINTTELAKRAGSIGCMSYLLIGILILPLVICMSELVKRFPAGGFYSFAEPIHPFAGFISTWIYFTAKLASASLMIHTAMTLLQNIVPNTQSIPTLFLDIVILSLFITLNLQNLKTGSTIQKIFVISKMLPICFLTGTALLFFNTQNIINHSHEWKTLIDTLPLVLYATVGFEAACSLSSRIDNAAKNAPRVLLISYAIAILILTTYQFLFYGTLGQLLESIGNFTKPFPALVELFAPSSIVLSNKIISILHLAIACSALGGSYGILFSNSWNLYTLAKNNHTFYASKIAQLNSNTIPFICVLAEGILCGLYLTLTQGYQITLQQLSALGCITTYTMSIISLILIAQKTVNTKLLVLSVAGLLSCSILMINCTCMLAKNSSHALLAFLALAAFGSSMFMYQKTVNSFGKNKPLTQ